MFGLFSAAEALKARGMRVTPQRIAVYNVLKATDDHPSVETVYERVRSDCPSISLNTVYTTLCKMAEIGLIRPIDAGDGLCRYDGNPHPHAHVVCTSCRRVEDLDVRIDLDEKEAASRSDYTIDDVAVYFYGKCADCRKLSNRSIRSI
jgi:Fur family peroxide stress response transcriptional regulator